MTQTHAALERAAQKLADKYLNDFSPEGDGKRPNAFALDVVQIVAAALAQEAAGDGSEIADSRSPACLTAATDQQKRLFLRLTLTQQGCVTWLALFEK